MPALVLLILAALVATAAAQGDRFDVASIHSNGTPGAPPLVSVLPGGRLSAPNATLRQLIRTAYDIDDDRILGGPEWISRERFAVDARAGAADSTDDQMRAMLARLLAERFNLQVHRDTRELPVYVLTLARNDGRMGPRIRAAGAECLPIAPPSGVPPPPPPPPGDSMRRPLAPANAGLRCPSMFFPGWIAGRAMTMAQLAPRVAPYAGRPVIDHTGLAGEYDFDLAYTPERPPILNGATLPPTSDGASLFTAIREQLGLALEARPAPLGVLVIDRAERPTEN